MFKLVNEDTDLVSFDVSFDVELNINSVYYNYWIRCLYIPLI